MSTKTHISIFVCVNQYVLLSPSYPFVLFLNDLCCIHLAIFGVNFFFFAWSLRCKRFDTRERFVGSYHPHPSQKTKQTINKTKIINKENKFLIVNFYFFQPFSLLLFFPLFVAILILLLKINNQRYRHTDIRYMDSSYRAQIILKSKNSMR